MSASVSVSVSVLVVVVGLVYAADGEGITLSSVFILRRYASSTVASLR